MFFRTIGEGDNIVLLHGWGFDSTIMQPLATILGSTHCAIIIDLPGYGMNQRQYFPDTLPEITDIISTIIPEQSTIIGWSLGGLIALQLALTKKNVGNVIVIAGTPCFMAKKEWPAMPRLTFNRFLNQVENGVALGLDTFLFLNARGEADEKTAYEQLRNRMGETVSKQTLLNGLTLLATTDLRHDLKNITCPIHFIYSE